MIPHMTGYIDIGVNLTGSSFKNALDDVIQRALDVGVTQMIVTGTDMHHSQADLFCLVQTQQLIDATIIKFIAELVRETEGLKGQDQVLQKMARIHEMVPIGTITVFPGTPEKNG